MEKKPLITLPVASTALEDDPEFVHPGGSAELRIEFERDGVRVRSGLRFSRVRAFRFRAEGHCTSWHVQGAYDTVVEVEPSSWLAELLDAEASETWGRWKIRHFLIYLDGAGAYEVAAEDVSMLAEEAAS
ncbi:hypothetical protein [Nocardioides sp. MH1]|uniref:hypothetical protein n=1 Tax=Nocardioides sp. MH1 TaxID=3242490 RepID=UPI003520F2BD